MGQFKEYIKLALMNIRSNKVRTFLTMLGIIIGVSSVILIISLGNGVSGEISGSLDSLAGGQMYVGINSSNTEAADVSFDFSDLEAIEELDGVVGTTPTYNTYGTSISQKGVFTTWITSGTEDLELSSKDPLLSGRYFTEEEVNEHKSVCVLKERSAIALFGTADVVGMPIEVEIGNKVMDVTVVGVRKANPSKMFNMMYNEDEVEMEIPYTVFGDAYNWDIASDGFSGFYVFTSGTADTTLLAAQLQAIMEARHNCRGKNVIQIQDFNSVMDQINNVMGTITLFVVVVAGISLLVGGIGVMTIMLVSVTERTREIGIRKALGARTGTIMLQFLIESGLISLCAGIIGIITGVALASIVGYFLDFKATIDIVTVLGASIFSSAVGIFFGIYPAKKAAKLSPIEALRHE